VLDVDLKELENRNAKKFKWRYGFAARVSATLQMIPCRNIQVATVAM
jgi:hypothetical protein